LSLSVNFHQTVDNIETDQRQSIKKKIETNG